MSPSDSGPGASAGRRRAARAAAAVALVLPWVVLHACVDSTGPPHALIEATEFAPSLNVDLGAMIRIDGGLYVQDVALGDGGELTYDHRVVLAYDLYLPDGRLALHRDSAVFVMGCNDVVPGLEAGARGMRVGGSRRIVVPPRLGYGEAAPWPLEVPPFSILVYEVEARAAIFDPCEGTS